MNKNSQRQHQQEIFDPEEAMMQDSTPVTCFGMRFKNNDVIMPSNLLQKGHLKKAGVERK
jgi:hypothetical protein